METLLTIQAGNANDFRQMTIDLASLSQGRPGVDIREITIEAHVPEREGLAALCAQAGLSFDPETMDVQDAYGLPPEPEKGSTFLKALGRVRDKRETWVVQWSRVPGSSPPSEVVAASEKMEGIAGLAEKLRVVWPSSDKEATFAAMYRLSGMRTRLWSRGRRSLGNLMARPGVVLWELRPKQAKLSESPAILLTIQEPEKGQLSVGVFTQLALEDWPDARACEENMWNTISHLFVGEA